MKTYIVGVHDFRPLAFESEGTWSGFEVDLWEEVAKRNNLTYEYKSYQSFSELLASAEKGEVDVAVAGITRTVERSKKFPLSFYTLATGLSIGVRKHRSVGFRDMIRGIFSRPIQKIFLGLLLFGVIAAHGYWLFEKGLSVSETYLPGVWESFWWVLVTVSTVGYGDISPATMAGQAFGIVTILAGLAIFGIFIAQLSAALTAERAASKISSTDDLSGRVVAVKAGTTAIGVAKSYGATVKEFATVTDAIQSVLRGTADAVIADAPALQAKITPPDLLLVGGLFARQSYSFAFAPGSKIKDDINTCLVAVHEDDTYDTLYDKYFE